MLCNKPENSRSHKRHGRKLVIEYYRMIGAIVR